MNGALGMFWWVMKPRSGRRMVRGDHLDGGRGGLMIVSGVGLSHGTPCLADGLARFSRAKSTSFADTAFWGVLEADLRARDSS